MTCDTLTASPGNAVPSTGRVIAFPTARRRERDAIRADEPRGEILLFLGVRYERIVEQEPAPRRRRRS